MDFNLGPHLREENGNHSMISEMLVVRRQWILKHGEDFRCTLFIYHYHSYYHTTASIHYFSGKSLSCQGASPSIFFWPPALPSWTQLME